MYKAIIAISVGSAAGALLRWFLGLKLNSLLPWLPPGTLAANLIGGYIVGIALAVLVDRPDISPEWRLLIITGFCGGLTTFSTFSLDAFYLLENGAYSAAAAYVLSSVALSIIGFAAGMTCARVLLA